VAGQIWLLVLVRQVVISDFAIDEQCKGAGHYLGSHRSEGKESVSW
jgi:hypothetical protein